MPYQQMPMAQATPPPPEQEEGWDWWQKALVEVGMPAVGAAAGFFLGGPAGVAPGLSVGRTLAGPTADIIRDEPEAVAQAYGSQGALSAPQQQVAQQPMRPGPSLYGGVPSSMRASAPELAGMTRAQAQALGISEEVWQRGQSPLGIYNMQAYG